MLLFSFAAVLFAYLLGSISFAVLVSKAMGLSDPRSYGSGNPGATNVLRSGSKKAAVLTLLGDCLKGVVAVLTLRYTSTLGYVADWAIGIGSIAVFFGHLFPVFHHFKGGKGVATAAGVLLALDWSLGLSVIAIWVLVAFVLRYSSLAALCAAISAPVMSLMIHGGDGQAAVVAVIAFALIIRHWQNLQRLMAGKESKIGSKG